MTLLASLKNIGERSAHWLEAVGIYTEEDLMAVGVVEAYRRAKAAFPDRVTLNLLYALQGALLDLSWNELPPGLRSELRRQVEELNSGGLPRPHPRGATHAARATLTDTNTCAIFGAAAHLKGAQTCLRLPLLTCQLSW